MGLGGNRGLFPLDPAIIDVEKQAPDIPPHRLPLGTRDHLTPHNLRTLTSALFA